MMIRAEDMKARRRLLLQLLKRLQQRLHVPRRHRSLPSEQTPLSAALHYQRVHFKSRCWGDGLKRRAHAEQRRRRRVYLRECSRQYYSHQQGGRAHLVARCCAFAVRMRSSSWTVTPLR